MIETVPNIPQPVRIVCTGCQHEVIFANEEERERFIAPRFTPIPFPGWVYVGGDLYRCRVCEGKKA